MSHPTDEKLIKYVDEQLPKSERTLVEIHLSSPCLRCTNKIGQLRLVLQTTSHDQTATPPSNIFSRAVAFFQQRPATPHQSPLRVLAEILFDNRTRMPLSATARHEHDTRSSDAILCSTSGN